MEEKHPAVIADIIVKIIVKGHVSTDVREIRYI